MRFILFSILLITGTALADQTERYFGFAMDKMREGNYAEAYCFLRPLAENGDDKAQYSLGWMYHNGYGLKINDEAAYFWWSQAAQSNTDAQFAMALLLEQGLGIEQDYGKAAEFYVRSMQSGNEEARSYIRSILSEQDGAMRQALLPAIQGNWKYLGGESGSVRSEKANVRRGSSTKSRILFTLNRGKPVHILNQDGKWYFILDEEQTRTGWVHQSLVVKDKG